VRFVHDFVTAKNEEETRAVVHCRSFTKQGPAATTVVIIALAGPSAREGRAENRRLRRGPAALDAPSKRPRVRSIDASLHFLDSYVSTL
jgi:hypothetical protein